MLSGSFRCDVFGAGDSGSSLPGLLEVTSDSLHLMLEDGRVFNLPGFGVKLSHGGFDGLHVIIEGTAETGEQLYLAVQDVGILKVIGQSGPVELRPIARSLALKVSAAKTWSFVAFWGFVCIVLVIVAALWLGFDILVERAVSVVPPSLESAMGASVVQSLAAGKKEIVNGPLYDGVMKVWDRLQAGIGSDSQYTFKIYIYDDPTVNAMAAPGGHVVIFSGLLKEVDSPEELAGILAHELQHVVKKHSLKRLVQSAGLKSVFGIIFGNNSTINVIIREYGGKLATLSYSRDQEREADRLAVDLLVKAKIDPTRFPEFFKRLSAKGSSMPKMFTIISTHPADDERGRLLNEKFQSISATQYEPIAVDWQKLKSSIVSLPAQAFPPYK